MGDGMKNNYEVVRTWLNYIYLCYNKYEEQSYILSLLIIQSFHDIRHINEVLLCLESDFSDNYF
jgi:hypothetical protein